MVVGLDVHRIHQINLAGVHHNQARALAQAALHARGKHGVGVAGVGANHHDHIGMLYGLKGLSTGGRAQGLAQAIAGG